MNWYWFNIKLGHDFKYGPGVYAQWVNLAMSDESEILWEDCHPTETDAYGNPKVVWNPEPLNLGFEYKDEIVPFVKENPEKVRDAVLYSYEYEESVHLWKHYSVYCHNCYDEDGKPLKEY